MVRPSAPCVGRRARGPCRGAVPARGGSASRAHERAVLCGAVWRNRYEHSGAGRTARSQESRAHDHDALRPPRRWHWDPSLGLRRGLRRDACHDSRTPLTAYTYIVCQASPTPHPLNSLARIHPTLALLSYASARPVQLGYQLLGDRRRRTRDVNKHERALRMSVRISDQLQLPPAA